MSFQTWHDYGYGINTSNIPEASVEQMNALLNHAPNFKAKVNAWLVKKEITEPTYDNYLECDDLSMYGLASVLAEVIEEAEGIVFTACSNFEGDQFLIYQPSYPWSLPEAEATLTIEKIDEILNRYVSILTDEPIEIDHQSVENGG